MEVEEMISSLKSFSLSLSLSISLSLSAEDDRWRFQKLFVKPKILQMNIFALIGLLSRCRKK